MILEIVTPEATLLNTEVESVSVPGVNGEFQMLNNHASIVSVLTSGTIKFKGTNISIDEEHKNEFTNTNDEYRLDISSGTIEMNNNKVIVLAD